MAPSLPPRPSAGHPPRARAPEAEVSRPRGGRESQMEEQKENVPRREHTGEEKAEASAASVSLPSRLRSLPWSSRLALGAQRRNRPCRKAPSVSGRRAQSSSLAEGGAAARESGNNWTAAGKRSCFPGNRVSRGILFCPALNWPRSDCVREPMWPRAFEAALPLIKGFCSPLTFVLPVALYIFLFF